MNNLQARIHIDFEEWANLAKADPDSFERLRSNTLAQAISRAPSDRQQHLRCLQWRVDRVRERTTNPLAACIAISDMMWDTFQSLNASYRDLATPGPVVRPTAKVIRFQRVSETT